MRGDRPLSLGFGVHIMGHIPFASLASFAARYGIDDLGEFHRFIAIVSELDAHELALINKPKPGS